MKNVLFSSVVGVFVFVCVAAKDNSSTTTTPNTPATTPSSTVGQRCMSRNSSCGDCVAHAECLWCPTKYPSCLPYPTGDIIPGKDTCSLSDARWGVCWVNYEVLLICMGVLGGVILLSMCCCVYCCCCRTNKSKQRRKYQKEEERIDQERQEREMKHSERKAERKQKYDEIRKKYGLIKDDNPYQRFDDQ